MKRKILVMVLALVLTFINSPFSVSAGSLTCSRTSCNNKDPLSYVCANDAYTAVVEYASSGVSGNLETDLRYSPQCIANWTRVTNTYPGAARHLRAELWNSTKTTILESWESNSFPSGWTNMYDGSYVRCSKVYQAPVGASWDAITAYGCG